jgi:Ca2+-binding EF-hand superfamily protein
MKNISLSQISSVVVIMLAASFFVSANEVSTIITAADKPVKQSINEVVFNTLDLDKDGSLSKAEIISSNNEVLVSSFQKIDSNADLLVSKKELADFVDQVKGA